MHLPYQCGFKRRNVRGRNAVSAILLLNLINNNLLFFFLTENLPIWNPYLPQRPENMRPHSSNSIKNATPL